MLLEILNDFGVDLLLKVQVGPCDSTLEGMADSQ